MRTLHGYVLREVVQYVLVGGLAALALLVLPNTLRQLRNLVGMGLVFEDILQLLAALSVRFAAYALPIAFLFGVSSALSRLSSKNEIMAMHTLGVSLRGLMTPLLLLALLVCAGAEHLLNHAEPQARRELREIVRRVAARGQAIRPGRFNTLDREGNRLLYVDAREGETLRGVFVFDRSREEQPYTVAAEAGRFTFDAEALSGHLLLQRGAIHFESRDPKDTLSRRILFDSFDYAFDMSRLAGLDSSALQPREMDTRQIREVLDHFERTGEAPEAVRVRERARYEVQYHQRRALPAAPLVFALVGIPLSARSRWGGRSRGVVLCAGIVFAYYLLLTGAAALADSALLPAWVAAWAPNVVLALFGVALLARSTRPRA